MKGRKPKPTALKKMEGNRGKRKLNKNEPRPEGRPTCPAWLRKEAKREWRRIVPELGKIGLLSNIDRMALAGYCQVYAKWREAEEFLDKYGSTYQIPKGAAEKDGGVVMLYSIHQYPQVVIARDSLAQIHKLLSEFGMTPASRVRLDGAGKSEPPEDDPLELLLRNPQSNKN